MICRPPEAGAREAAGQMLQTALPVQLTAGQVLLEHRVLLRLPLPVCLGADDRLPVQAGPRGDSALRLALHAGV